MGAGVVATRRGRVMRDVPPPLRGLVLDHLEFSDVLSATTTDRAGRALLGFVRRIFKVNDRILSTPHILVKFTLCETIFIESKTTLVFERLAWALQTLRHLCDVRVRFAHVTDQTSFRQSCVTLSNSPELGRLRVFHLIGTLAEASYKSDEFESLVLRLNPNCALNVAMSWGFPTPFISELIRRGANPNADFKCFSEANNMHVLEAACAKSMIEVVRVLLDAGAQPVESLSNGAFLLAANAGQLDIVRLLYDSGFKSTSRSPKERNNLLHCFAFALQRVGVARTRSLAKLICERQPELLTQMSKLGHTPLMALTMKHCLNQYRPNDTPSDRDASFKSLARCLITHESRQHTSE